MMDDIVEWLRNSNSDEWCSGQLLKAADEITRLRAENGKLRRDVKTAVMGDSAELQDVKRENEKLRRAMHEIYEVYAGCDGMLYGTSQFYIRHLIKEMADIAAEHKK